MQLDEATEKAFIAGYKFAMENDYVKINEAADIDRTWQEGYIEYINGNSESSQSTAVLDESSS